VSLNKRFSFDFWASNSDAATPPSLRKYLRNKQVAEENWKLYQFSPSEKSSLYRVLNKEYSQTHSAKPKWQKSSPGWNSSSDWKSNSNWKDSKSTRGWGSPTRSETWPSNDNWETEKVDLTKIENNKNSHQTNIEPNIEYLNYSKLEHLIKRTLSEKSESKTFEVKEIQTELSLPNQNYVLLIQPQACLTCNCDKPSETLIEIVQAKPESQKEKEKTDSTGTKSKLKGICLGK